MSNCLCCIDFGMSQHLTHNEVAESFRGSPLYMVSYTAHTFQRASNMLQYITVTLLPHSVHVQRGLR